METTCSCGYECILCYDCKQPECECACDDSYEPDFSDENTDQDNQDDEESDPHKN